VAYPEQKPARQPIEISFAEPGLVISGGNSTFKSSFKNNN